MRIETSSLFVFIFLCFRPIFVYCYILKLYSSLFEGCVLNILSNFENKYINNLHVVSASLLLISINSSTFITKFPLSGSPKRKKITTKIGCPCSVVFIDTFVLPGYSDLDILLDGITYNNLDPSFVILLTKSDVTKFQTLYNRHSYCLTSKFLLLHPVTGFYHLCRHCSLQVPLISRTEITILKFYETQKRVESKLKQSASWIYHTFSHIVPKNPKYLSCSYYYYGLDTSVFECVAYVLSSHLNYSLAPRYPGHRPLSQVVFGEPSGKSFNRARFLDPSVQKHVWFNYACSYNQYVLVMYSAKGQFNFLKLFQPMDSWLWIGLVVSYPLVGVLIWAVGCNTCDIKYTTTSIFNSLFLTFAILMEQSLIFSKTLRNNKTTMVLLSSWILSSFIISTCYKGDLFSHLTMETPPPTPNSFEAVANSSIMIATSTKHFYMGQPYSTLKDYVLADLTYGESYSQFYAKFRHYAKLLKGKIHTVVQNMSTNKPVDTDWGLIHMPQVFATASTKRDSDLMKVLVSRHTDYFIQEKKIGPNPYLSRMPWYGIKNEYTEMLVTTLGQLYESGIYSRWLANYDKKMMIDALRKGDKVMNVSSLNYYLLLVMKGEGVIKQADGAGFVKVESVQICFALYAVGVVVGVVFILVEALRGYKRSSDEVSIWEI
ncbi:Glutamate receptor 1 [Folsomia candida]|uniref:Glutamate receptor 1 n=1 Tax=Folsomia candida TaxID=158441 RepID=A0A226ENU2_FOLCA|nr:Glutamate receptor 1 [Folsomia candida]